MEPSAPVSGDSGSGGSGSYAVLLIVLQGSAAGGLTAQGPGSRGGRGYGDKVNAPLGSAGSPPQGAAGLRTREAAHLCSWSLAWGMAYFRGSVGGSCY